MIQRGQRLRFAREPGQAIRITGEGIRKDLQRDVAIQLRVPRTIHLAHPAGSQDGLDLVRAERRSRSQHIVTPI